MTMPLQVVPRSKRLAVVRWFTHEPLLIITARCGHQWSTSLRRCCEDDLCRSFERLLDHHESLCRPGLTHRPGW